MQYYIRYIVVYYMKILILCPYTSPCSRCFQTVWHMSHTFGLFCSSSKTCSFNLASNTFFQLVRPQSWVLNSYAFHFYPLHGHLLCSCRHIYQVFRNINELHADCCHLCRFTMSKIVPKIIVVVKVKLPFILTLSIVYWMQKRRAEV